ncbi:MAG: AAA family ATPase [Gammaproteobacteria bacterium]|nr:AAA family ATPase [Gammaproteobacteria bacterium]
MYLEHFGMQELPFSLTPDTSFYYDFDSHRDAFNVLKVALHAGEGFIKIIGEVGSGKTMLCRKLLNTLDDQYFITAYIPDPFLTPDTLRMSLATELGIKFDKDIHQHQLLELIKEKLIQQSAVYRRPILLLDEAQALPDESIEALRLLTNLETEKTKLLQVVLFAQPELDVRLSQPHLRQLRQRIIFSQTLKAIDQESLEGYISHRLLVAGYQGQPIYGKQALRSLYRASQGVPRVINILCHKSLMAAYGEGTRRVTKRHVDLAVNDTEDILPERPFWKNILSWPSMRV